VDIREGRLWEGAIFGTRVMQLFPVDVPKLIISTMASGSRTFGPYTGTKDILIMHSVVDISGLHQASRIIFDNAAGAMIGMLDRFSRGKPHSLRGDRAVFQRGALMALRSFNKR
jgi:uncharacterized protein (UPF0261 family)